MMSTLAVSTPTYRYSQTIGNQGGPPVAGFTGPVDVALGPEGLLYVISSYYEFSGQGKFVSRFNLNEDYLGAFGAFGTEDGKFTWPNSLAVDKAGNVHVTDEWLQQISVFDPEGNFTHKWGTEGEGDGEWNRPAGIVFDVDDNLLVVDSLNHRIQKFSADGRFLDKWGGPGAGEGQFNMPWGITVDGAGNAYVADWRNDRIQKFTGDGNFLLEFGVTGDGDGEFHRPSGVGVDQEGYIYVVDWGNDRVQAFDPEGRFVTKFLGDCPGYSKWAVARMASNPENMEEQRQLVKDFGPERRFFQPTGIEVDSDNRIIIADTGRHRLQIYQKVSG